MIKCVTDLLNTSLLSNFEVESTSECKEENTVTITYSGEFDGYTLESSCINGLKNGEAMLLDKKGVKIASITFKDDKIEGRCQLFTNGSLSFTGFMIDGVRNGICTEYDKNLNIIFFGRYKNNQKVSMIQEVNGSFHEMDMDGKLLYVGGMDKVEYLREGLGVEYKEGIPVEMAIYKKGKREKCLKQFHDGSMVEFDGEVKVYEGDYNSAFLREGKGKEYSNGTVRYDGNWVNNQKNGKGIEYKNGSILYIGEWKEGVCLENGHYGRYANKKQISTIEQKGSVFCEYSMDGELFFSGGMLGDHYLRDGIGTEYVDGTPVSVGFYKENMLIRSMKQFKIDTMYEFDENGQTIYEGEYRNNFEHQFPRYGVGEEYLYGIKIYKGEWRNNKREGMGIEFSNNAVLYNGQWKNGYPNGKGILMKNGGTDKEYEGSFTNGYYNTNVFYKKGVVPIVEEKRDDDVLCFTASGKIQYIDEKDGTRIIYEEEKPIRVEKRAETGAAQCVKEFKGKTMIEYNESGQKIYEGEFCNNYKHGFPRTGNGEEYANGVSLYKGKWKNNQPNGKGVYKGKNTRFTNGYYMKGTSLCHYANGSNLQGKTILKDGLKKVILENNETIKEDVLQMKPQKSIRIREDGNTWLLNETGRERIQNLEKEEEEEEVRRSVSNIMSGKKDVYRITLSRKEELSKVSPYVTHLRIRDGCCSDDEVAEMDFSIYPYLRSLKIGKGCFIRTRRLVIKNLKELKRIVIGDLSFCGVHEIVLEDLAALESISLYDRALRGDYSDSRCGRVFAPYHFKNTLSMKNLPLFNQLTLYGYKQFGCIGHITLENIPNYRDSILIQYNVHQFNFAYDVHSSNANGLYSSIAVHRSPSCH